MAERAGHLLAQPRQQRVEQFERLALVLVEGVLLGLGAQADALTQMVERQQVLLPELVEQLEEHAPRDEAQHLRTSVGRLFGHSAVYGAVDAVADLTGGHALISRQKGKASGREREGASGEVL